MKLTNSERVKGERIIREQLGMSPKQAREALQRAEAKMQLETWRKEPEKKEQDPVEKPQGIKVAETQTKVTELKQEPPAPAAPAAQGGDVVDAPTTTVSIIVFRAGALSILTVLTPDE